MKKILVCGTGFGKYYLKAIKSMEQEVELVGIFSRGSKQSAHWADELKVPLYTSYEQLDSIELDIACVVVRAEIVGGKGTEIVEYFMNRGIHVFQEHPVHYEAYANSVKMAKRHNCQYFMNTFYPFLRSVDVFFQALEEVKKRAKINYVRAECTIQVLFPMIDILGRITGNMHSFQLDKTMTDQVQSPFAVLRGTISKVPFILLVKNEMDVNNEEGHMALFHQINVNTSVGNLTLTDVHGQVTWTPAVLERSKIEGKNVNLSTMVLQQSFLDIEGDTMEDIFEKLWPGSIRRSLRQFIHVIDSKDSNSKLHQHYLGVCKAWNDVGINLGGYRPLSYEITGPMELKKVEDVQP